MRRSGRVHAASALLQVPCDRVSVTLGMFAPIHMWAIAEPWTTLPGLCITLRHPKRQWYGGVIPYSLHAARACPYMETGPTKSWMLGGAVVGACEGKSPCGVLRPIPGARGVILDCIGLPCVRWITPARAATMPSNPSPHPTDATRFPLTSSGVVRIIFDTATAEAQRTCSYVDFVQYQCVGLCPCT